MGSVTHECWNELDLSFWGSLKTITITTFIDNLHTYPVDLELKTSALTLFLKGGGVLIELKLIEQHGAGFFAALATPDTLFCSIIVGYIMEIS